MSDHRKSRAGRHGSTALGLWARKFRAAARRDGYRKLAERLGEIGYLEEIAPAVVENTVRLVSSACAHRAIDGRDDVEDVLRLQVYDIERARARYILCFEPYGPTFLLIDEMSQVDLVDLFNAPPGFWQLGIRHVDGTDLDSVEGATLERQIREDFGFDFAPEELILEIDADPSGITVNVCESDQAPPWRL